jgi:hypothetical protein
VVAAISHGRLRSHDADPIAVWHHAALIESRLSSRSIGWGMQDHVTATSTVGRDLTLCGPGPVLGMAASVGLAAGLSRPA